MLLQRRPFPLFLTLPPDCYVVEPELAGKALFTTNESLPIVLNKK